MTPPSRRSAAFCGIIRVEACVLLVAAKASAGFPKGSASGR